ncbi:hypothetical protein VC83_06048 [Pseudogymnoascus destructans]|uniref:Uncharacterized protein n=1 Tax=Pseudogymnoascus destructans TaxID=655981 RepID=A0A177A4C5_9PEZI|nr:uncharacterized protein VC83_06048 [Pseudogymnoascus destructans]OAF57018.1 hypothetical protein VC83_06048 [Pseudogymnoascus destructans]
MVAECRYCARATTPQKFIVLSGCYGATDSTQDSKASFYNNTAYEPTSRIQKQNKPDDRVGDDCAPTRNLFAKMPVLLPPGALPAAYRVLCMRCVRRIGTPDDAPMEHECVWSEKSSKCAYCVKQKAPCVPILWFLEEEYAAIVAAEAATPPVPATTLKTYKEVARVADLSSAAMPALRSPFEGAQYIQGLATLAAIKDLAAAVEGLKEDTGKLLAGQARAVSLLGTVDKTTNKVGKEVSFVATAVAKVEKAVGKLAGAVAVAPRNGGKRKRGEEEEGNGENPIG